MIKIGDWVRRTVQYGKWHLVDSTVDTRVVTRCGREMEVDLHGQKLAVSLVKPLTRMIGQPQLCWQCDRAEAVS